MNKAFELWQWENEPSAETPLSAEFLNRLNNGLNEVDNRVINQNTTKLDVTTANTMVKDVTFDSASGIFTITKLNGSTFNIDTKLEKLAVNFEFDSSTQTLNIILEDGTTQTVDLSALITQYEFGESDTIVLTVGSNGKVVANIKNGSITGDMLEPNYLANVTTQADNARVSAETATAQADRATSEADRAEDAADRAESVSAVDIATVEKAGIVKPDGTTITVDADGTIHGSSQGVSQEDFNKVIDGTTTVGNADKLDNHDSSYFAPKTDLANYLPLTSYNRQSIHGDWRISYGSNTPLGSISTSGDMCLYGFGGSTNSWLGSLGFNGLNKPVFVSTAGGSGYELLHTGNKPSGTYTGNGSATARTINTKGLGSNVIIRGNGYTTLISGNTAFGCSSAGLHYIVQGVSFYNGDLALSTTHEALNASGVTYKHEVI